MGEEEGGRWGKKNQILGGGDERGTYIDIKGDQISTVGDSG